MSNTPDPAPTDITFLRNDLATLAEEAARDRAVLLSHLKLLTHEQAQTNDILRTLVANTSTRRLSRIVGWQVFFALIAFSILTGVLAFVFGLAAL